MDAKRRLRHQKTSRRDPPKRSFTASPTEFQNRSVNRGFFAPKLVQLFRNLHDRVLLNMRKVRAPKRAALQLTAGCRKARESGTETKPPKYFGKDETSAVRAHNFGSNANWKPNPAWCKLSGPDYLYVQFIERLCCSQQIIWSQRIDRWSWPSHDGTEPGLQDFRNCPPLAGFCVLTANRFAGKIVNVFPGRLKVGHQVLVLSIEVRVLDGQQNF